MVKEFVFKGISYGNVQKKDLVCFFKEICNNDHPVI